MGLALMTMRIFRSCQFWVIIKRDPHVWNAELASEMLLRPPCPVHNIPMIHVFVDGF